MLDTFPGELAPKMALAATAELAGNADERKFYETVWSTDDGVISAAFGLARAQSAEGDRARAVRTLDEVPATSRHFTTARLTSAVTLLSGRTQREITEEQIRDAARRVEALPPTEPRVLQIRALVLGGAMDWLRDNKASTNHILGFPFTMHGLRLGVEASLRSLARVAPTQATPLRAGGHGQQRAAHQHVLGRFSWPACPRRVCGHGFDCAPRAQISLNSRPQRTPEALSAHSNNGRPTPHGPGAECRRADLRPQPGR